MSYLVSAFSQPGKSQPFQPSFSQPPSSQPAPPVPCLVSIHRCNRCNPAAVCVPSRWIFTTCDRSHLSLLCSALLSFDTDTDTERPARFASPRLIPRMPQVCRLAFVSGTTSNNIHALTRAPPHVHPTPSAESTRPPRCSVNSHMCTILHVYVCVCKRESREMSILDGDLGRACWNDDAICRCDERRRHPLHAIQYRCFQYHGPHATFVRQNKLRLQVDPGDRG